MRRKAFCAVADIEPRRFDTLMTRGQVPFTKAEDGWGEYSLDDAFRLRLMLDLIDDGGCEIATAITAMRQGLTTLWITEYPLRPDKLKEDVWLAIASIAFPHSDEFIVTTEYLCAPAHLITAMVQGIGENIVETTDLLDRAEWIDGEDGPELHRVNVADLGYAPNRVIMANASLAARKVISAAKALDIKLTDDDFPKFYMENVPDPLRGMRNAIEGWQKYVERTREMASD